MRLITLRRLLVGVVMALAGTVTLSAQNPVTIYQVGPSTVVTTTVPVSGTVTATQGTAAPGTAGWPILNGNGSQATATWTSASGVNSTIALASMNNFGSAIVTIKTTSTITGGVVSFEATDNGTDYYPVWGTRTTSFKAESVYTLTATTNQAWQVYTSAWARLQVRLSTAITGTGSAVVLMTPNTTDAPSSVVATQSTAADLQATVVGTGTFATQSAITAASGSIASGAIASGAVASGAFASGSIASGAIVDGADVTLGAKADAKSTATDTTAITIMQVLKQISASVQAPPSQAVTNGGTFATQSAITAASGSIASGAISSGAIASGAIASGAIASGAVASGAYASDSGSFGVGATGAAPPAKASFIGGLGSGATGGFVVAPSVCDQNKVISMTTATTTLMVTGVSARNVHICSFHALTAIANNVALVEGTGATCGTGTVGMAGGSTAANGWNFAANGGIALGTGVGDVLATSTTGDSVCIITSAAGPLSGFIKFGIY